MERLAPRPELLVGRSTEVAEDAEQRARKLLGRHPTLVATEVVDLIAQRETSLALEEYGKRRLEGQANDNYSQQPGLTVYLTHQGSERVVEMCKREGYPITETQIEEVIPDLVALKLPRGVYGMGMGGAQFYQEASADWERSNRADKPFALGYDDVVRIEGNANELWQNVNYNWDGTPKKTDSR